MLVSTILAQKGNRIISVSPDDRISDVAALLTRERIGAVLVRDPEQALVGILSERDIVNAIADQGSNCLEFAAQDLMTSEVVTCQPGDSLNQVMSQMTELRIRHVPVVDDGDLVGIISIGDVVKHRLAEVESEAESLREYITSA